MSAENLSTASQDSTTTDGICNVRVTTDAVHQFKQTVRGECIALTGAINEAQLRSAFLTVTAYCNDRHAWCLSLIHI